jgi:hypothetical protein
LQYRRRKTILPARSFDVSKQLSISAVLSALLMAAFVLSATPSALPRETGAPTAAAAPAFEASLPGL